MAENNQEEQTKKLLKMKAEIDKAKNKQAEIKGQITSIEKQIKDKFKIEVKDIDAELDRMADDLDDKEMIFQKGMEKLEKEFPVEE